MKPTASDFHFWEAYQARHVPGWARTIDARRSWHAKRYDAQPTACHLHAAINARAGIKQGRNALDTQNALVVLDGWTSQIRDHGYAFAGRGDGRKDTRPRTLADSLRVSLRDYGTDRKRNPRGPTFARILRRLEAPKT